MGPGWLTPVSWQPAGPAALRRLEVQGKSPGSCLPPGQIKDLACILRGITPSRPSSALTLASRSRSQCSLNFLCDVGGVGLWGGDPLLPSTSPATPGGRSSLPPCPPGVHMSPCSHLCTPRPRHSRVLTDPEGSRADQVSSSKAHIGHLPSPFAPLPTPPRQLWE